MLNIKKSLTITYAKQIIEKMKIGILLASPTLRAACEGKESMMPSCDMTI